MCLIATQSWWAPYRTMQKKEYLDHGTALVWSTKDLMCCARKSELYPLHGSTLDLVSLTLT